MSELHLSYNVEGGNFISCGQASEQVKRALKQLCIAPEVVRKVAIAMYEGEINMVIHADGGVADIDIGEDEIKVVLRDRGKGISDIEKAMTAGFSTATDNIREMGFGAGMGLPNMKKYSDRMKIDSTVGVGTTVTLEFDIV